MKAIGGHKTAAKAAALRAEIKRVWIERAQKYPYEPVTAAMVQKLLTAAVGVSTVRRHMSVIRGETLLRRLKGGRRDHHLASASHAASIAAGAAPFRGQIEDQSGG